MRAMTTHGHPTRLDDPGHPDAMSAGDHHGTGDHGDDGEHDDHAHAADDTLGPINTMAWGAGLLGVAFGVAVTVAFWLATQPIQPG
jgi:hypothetical protein